MDHNGAKCFVILCHQWIPFKFGIWKILSLPKVCKPTQARDSLFVTHPGPPLMWQENAYLPGAQSPVIWGPHPHWQINHIGLRDVDVIWLTVLLGDLACHMIGIPPKVPKAGHELNVWRSYSCLHSCKCYSLQIRSLSCTAMTKNAWPSRKATWLASQLQTCHLQIAPEGKALRGCALPWAHPQLQLLSFFSILPWQALPQVLEPFVQGTMKPFPPGCLSLHKEHT